MNKMEENKSYFGEIGHGLKTLAIGMKTTWKEYFKDFFTNKSTEQYPENRKTTLHVAKRHRGSLGVQAQRGRQLQVYGLHIM